MKNIIRNFYWKCIYPSRCYRMNQEKVVRLIDNFGGQELNLERIKKYKNSDTIFVLGTGQSINNFTANEWNEIRKHDSIGINDFCLKDFAPTFYSFELERQNMACHISRWERNANYIKNNSNFRNTLFLLRPYEPTTQILKDFIIYLDTNDMFMWHRIDELPGTSVNNIQDIQNEYIRNGLSMSNYYFPSRGSSLSWILFLIYKLNYRNVVLCGIDLHGQHFWQNSNQLEKIVPESKHETAVGSKGIGIIEIIDAYQKSIYKDINLTVSTRFSLLASKLPIYFKKI